MAAMWPKKIRLQTVPSSHYTVIFLPLIDRISREAGLGAGVIRYLSRYNQDLRVMVRLAVGQVQMQRDPDRSTALESDFRLSIKRQYRNLSDDGVLLGSVMPYTRLCGDVT